MKCNWDVIRKIMIKLEAIPTMGGQLESSEVCGVDNETVFYHMRLMIEAGLAVGGCPEMLGAYDGYLVRLTWSGHELLDKIRRDSIWNKIKETAKVKSIDLSAEVVKAIARTVIDSVISS
jgi:hypothetical protein